MSTYDLSRDLSIPPIAGIYAALQIKSFAKWSKSYCILKDLIKSIILLLNRVLNIHVFYIRINK